MIDANAATAAAAGLALIGAVWTLHYANATARRTLTAEYRARWDHPDFFDARVVTSSFLDCPEEERDAHWDSWKGDLDKRERLQIASVVDFWEEVASAFNQGYLDNEWFRTDFAWVLEHNWKRAEAMRCGEDPLYVRQLREEGWLATKLRLLRADTAARRAESRGSPPG